MFHVEHLDGFWGCNRAKDHLPAGRAGLIALAEPEEKKKAFGPQKAKGMTDEKSSTWNIRGCFAGNWTKGPLPARQAGLITLAEPGGKEKAFGLLRAKGNTEEKKFHVEH